MSDAQAGAWTPPDEAAQIAALDATWPALERAALGPWTLRRGGGGGRRAGSILPSGALPPDLDAALAAAAARSAAWGQPTIVQLWPMDGALDAALAARGWPVADRNLIMAAPSAAVAAQASGELVAMRVAGPLAILDEIWDAGGVGPARRAVMAAVACPSSRLLLRVGDRPAGAGFVAAHGTVAVLSALCVLPALRRRGGGRAGTCAAADWAAEQGAATLALAVTEDNAAARALYAGLGFAVVGRYHYRSAP